MSVAALLIGGRFDRAKVELTQAPQRIEVAGQLYKRLDDPDTGEYLGGYVAEPYGESHHDPGGR